MPVKVKIQSGDLVVEKEGAISLAGAAALLSASFLNASKPPSAVVLQVQTAPVRFTFNSGNTPTAIAGTRLDVDDFLFLDEPDEITNCKYILESGSPVIYYQMYQTRREG